ncbi:MAG: hypothetical protein F2672_03260 [Actinobacteria bacterium]|jgi:hypothetical protein|uniref:Unannotated protein n=1 Tax=freshwater metagenome TaxID=449393 RepID=A0A6J6TQ27_9ZZZZ|nr:hypothetical protein [Actinomycetota bacterium]MSZ66125.1 hypothetical protein [Actinomycetota bacterium]
MNTKFTILNGTPTASELAALEKALPTPVVKKVETASLWRKSQIRQPLPRKWGQSF